MSFLLDFVLLPLSAVAILFIYLFGFAHLRRRPFILKMWTLNVLFLSVLIPGYISILLFSLKHGKGAGEYLFGVLNPSLFFILLFLYLFIRFRRSFIVYNLGPLELRESLREVLRRKNWKIEEEREQIEVIKPRGRILIVNRWMGGVAVHIKGLEGEGFEGELFKDLSRIEVKPQIGPAIVNIVLATFLLFYLLKIVL